MTLRLNGSTSGYVELDAPAVAGTTSLTLPTGTGSAGQLLATDGAGALSFVNGGKILQVVRATDGTDRSTTSTSFVDVTGMSVTITPQKADSAILLACACRATVNTAAGDTYCEMRLRITDASNNAISGAERHLLASQAEHPTGGGIFLSSPIFVVAYATPATTSAVTYKLQFSMQASADTGTINNSNCTGQMYAIEVAA